MSEQSSYTIVCRITLVHHSQQYTKLFQFTVLIFTACPALHYKHSSPVLNYRVQYTQCSQHLTNVFLHSSCLGWLHT